MKNKKILSNSVKVLTASLFLVPIFSVGFLFPVKVVAENRNFVSNHLLVAVSPVNPLNPAEDVTPIDTPDEPSEYSTPEAPASQVEYPEETTTSTMTTPESPSSEKETEETKEVDPPKKELEKTKKKSLLKLPELSDYQTTLKEINLENSPDPITGPGKEPSPQTETGRTLACLSGTLLYGQKNTYSRS